MYDVRPADVLAPPALWSFALTARNVPTPKPHRVDCICPICIPRNARRKADQELMTCTDIG